MKTKEEIFMNHATKLKGEYVMTEPSAMMAMDEYANQRVTEVQDGLTREMHKLVMRVDESKQFLEMIDELPENRPLYRDSGLWQVRSDDMEEVLFQQSANESFSDFIKRAYNAENKADFYRNEID